MPKLKTDPIQASDLLEFLESESDFAFEVQVFNEVRRLKWFTSHSGTYDDPATNKPRQFDIRASFAADNSSAFLAIEAKRLSDWRPLLVQCLPRLPFESFHQLLATYDGERLGVRRMMPYMKMLEHPITIPIAGSESLYQAGELVGKATVHVGRLEKEQDGDKFCYKDSDVYERWAQAIASCHDLVKLACDAERKTKTGIHYSFVCPVLVVPDGTLWRVGYSQDGARSTDPEQTNRVSIFVRKRFASKPPTVRHFEYVVSHLEVVTFTGLTELLEHFSGPEDDLGHIVPHDTVYDRFVARYQQRNEPAADPASPVSE